MQGNQIRKQSSQIQMGCNSAETVAHPSATGVPQNARPIWPPLYPPAAIEGTGESDGDVATVARGAVEGAMETTRSVGLRAEDMAFSIARGAIAGTK